MFHIYPVYLLHEFQTLVAFPLRGVESSGTGEIEELTLFYNGWLDQRVDHLALFSR
jgi:hypothetical protein